MDQLHEIPWTQLELGTEYLILNVLQEPYILRVEQVETHDPVQEGEGRWGFVHTNSYLSFAIYERPPLHLNPNNRFYEVPEEDVIRQVREFCANSERVEWNDQAAYIQEIIGRYSSRSTLNLASAPHIGSLSIDVKGLFPNGDPISYEPFCNGDACVRIQQKDQFLFKEESLKAHFTAGKSTNPLTNERISVEDLERCTLAI